MIRLEESRTFLSAGGDCLPLFAGNKRWKLQHWLKQDDFKPGAFLVSHGGYQSNAMLALAQLARLKQVGFVYYTKMLPAYLQAAVARGDRCEGNLRHALALGMQLNPLEPADYGQLFGHDDPVRRAAALESRLELGPAAIFVPQGAACPQAEVRNHTRPWRATHVPHRPYEQEGIREVAIELNSYAQGRMRADGKSKPLLVVVPSGTGAVLAGCLWCRPPLIPLGTCRDDCLLPGTTPERGRAHRVCALHWPHSLLARPDGATSRPRLRSHASHPRTSSRYVHACPSLINGAPSLKMTHHVGGYAFARPSQTLLQVWNELQSAALQSQVPRSTPASLPLLLSASFAGQQSFGFDLVYAPRTWQTLFHHWGALSDYDLLYVHTGGLEGNPSQLKRYQATGWPDTGNVQKMMGK
jgi:hypothetical protein